MINAAKHIYHKIPIPTPIRAKVREGINRVHDLLNPHLPPRRIRVWISPLWFDYDRTGSDQLEYFMELGGLRPTDHFLDIACGVGRIAAPLTRYLAPSGGYEGFDLHKDVSHGAGTISRPDTQTSTSKSVRSAPPGLLTRKPASIPTSSHTTTNASSSPTRDLSSPISSPQALRTI